MASKLTATQHRTGPDHETFSVVPPRAASENSAASDPKAHRPACEATPSMAQFLEIKAANPDSLLWYRMGDFYELFFGDAVVASKALGIVLTKRGKHLGEDIPMCGVPVHKADDYLQRLIRQGYRVAVCEQLEDPADARKRGSKAVVRRDVVRLVTPGTLTEDTLLDPARRNYLTALFALTADRTSGGERELAGSSHVAVASIDISTGDFEVGEVLVEDLAGELVRLSPSEVIASDDVLAGKRVLQWIEASGAVPTPVPRASFDSLAGERNLKAQLNVTDLSGFGGLSRAELAAIGGILRYIELTQIGQKPPLRPPKKCGSERILLIDAASRASLELVRSITGERSGSLLAAIDRTVTGPGARELAARLSSPLVDLEEIEARLDSVAFLIDDEVRRDALRDALQEAPDIARAKSRLSFGRGGPRDLAAIRDGLAAAQKCSALLRASPGAIGLPADLDAITGRLTAAGDDLRVTLNAAVTDDPPHLRKDGGFIRLGYHQALDEARQLRDASRKVIARLEAQYAEETGIRTLKIRHNNVIGYFIEVTQLNAKSLLKPPHDELFRHRQTMANAVRFTTRDLSEIEGRIASAGERALQLEQDIFAELADEIGRKEAQLFDVAGAMAELDHTAALAQLAHDEGYARPRLERNQAFDIRGGRHPVVEQALRRAKAGPFIENDCLLGPQTNGPHPETADEVRVWLVTGPNMAGKSTFLRQNALIAVLAQMGSYVPAREATIGVADRLFSRVGATDDLARGRSTFMVEMIETAGILNQATARSLVILDEIGRGTATFDGLSIAWATLEYLHDVIGCRTLFATHYHELASLSERLTGVANVTMDVKEWRDDIVFLHKVKPGAADRSYGVQVAKLAGLPVPVIKRAREVLARLEKSGYRGQGNAHALEELPLFAQTLADRHPGDDHETSEVLSRLEALNVDDLTPRAALDMLYDLKALALRKCLPD